LVLCHVDASCFYDLVFGVLVNHGRYYLGFVK
jgi:hypothetical protein